MLIERIVGAARRGIASEVRFPPGTRRPQAPWYGAGALRRLIRWPRGPVQSTSRMTSPTSCWAGMNVCQVFVGFRQCDRVARSLILAATRADSAAIRTLLSCNARPNFTENYPALGLGGGTSPLIEATKAASETAVRQLLESRASASLTDASGRSALHAAAAVGGRAVGVLLTLVANGLAHIDGAHIAAACAMGQPSHIVPVRRRWCFVSSRISRYFLCSRRWRRPQSAHANGPERHG